MFERTSQQKAPMADASGIGLMPLLVKVAAKISTLTGQPFTLQAQTAIGGGCINQAYRLTGTSGDYFVKLNDASRHAMLAAEFAGLQALQQAGAVRVPTPIGHGVIGPQSYLILEYIALGCGNAQSFVRFGHQLADLHRQTQSRFGWEIDNTIGATPQHNSWAVNWVDFWVHQRLHPQLERAAQQGYRGDWLRQGEQLLVNMGVFFAHYQPVASLLHGDLWAGNYGVDQQGQPVIFDPAVYYGDRETDIAMTELFGGFEKQFYRAYQEVYPLDVGYSVRKTLYNLYHLLNHLNLFGGGYQAQVSAAIGYLLSEIRG